MRSRRERACWRGDWWGGALECRSPNQDRRPEAVEIGLVVLHSISLPPGVFRGKAVERLFCNTLDSGAHPYFARLHDLRVSAHFFVRRDGTTLQFVGCDARAWHAGVSAWRGRERCNDYSVGIEIEGLEGGSFTSAQYGAVARLLRALAARYPMTEVVGHEHVAPGRKSDPGGGFDWARLRRRLGRATPRIWPMLHGAA